jgi:hypothetical protein
MQRRKTKMKTAAAVFCLLLCISSVSSTYAQETLPKAGTVIDKSNADTYKNLFPDFWMDAFETGFDGFIAPLAITIKDTESNPMPKEFLAASELNKGKYSIDPEGYITGGPAEDIVGYPFPDLDKNDPQFTQKLMWNYDYKYTMDDMRGHFINYEKRKGSTMTTSEVESWLISFQGRLFDDPKPLYETKQGLRTANLMRNLYPSVQRNFMTLLIRSIDQKEADTTYIYLPSMRRVLRGEAGQRSTPINSSTQAPDDFFGFSGKSPEFTYELVAEQKAIAMTNAQWNYETMKNKDVEDLIPIETDGWEVRDVYVIAISSKDEKYPQGKKIIWIDKETMTALYAAAWDRAGELWKIWQIPLVKLKNNSGEGTAPYATNLGIDLQLGYCVQMFATWDLNGNGVKDSDVSSATMRKLAR